MKTLPDSPNLDHLRQQAKDLLAGLRDSQPGASLADAQAALADQYGFRAWTDLKAEVDRRRGRLDIADRSLAREIAARYRLGEVTGPMRSVARADEMGRQWSLETAHGRWAVRTMDTWIPIVDAETDVALQRAAAGAGILLPAPVRSRSGGIVESVGGHRWRVYQWLPSGPPLAAPVSSAITHAVGGILATIHRLRLPVDRISPWYASRLSRVAWPDLAAAARASRAGWAAELTEAVPVLVDLETIVQAAPAAAPVLCHTTLGPANARCGANGRLVVVGWEHAGGLPPSWELGDALVHWTIDPGRGVNAAGARAMVDGYRSAAGPDTLPELDLSMFSGAVTGLANYVFGEVNQAMNASDEEDRRHADRSVRHLLSHLPSRASLEQLLDATRATAPRMTAAGPGNPELLVRDDDPQCDVDDELGPGQQHGHHEQQTDQTRRQPEPAGQAGADTGDPPVVTWPYESVLYHAGAPVWIGTAVAVALRSTVEHHRPAPGWCRWREWGTSIRPGRSGRWSSRRCWRTPLTAEPGAAEGSTGRRSPL